MGIECAQVKGVLNYSMSFDWPLYNLVNQSETTAHDNAHPACASTLSSKCSNRPPPFTNDD